jgi:hypothetical protein
VRPIAEITQFLQPSSLDTLKQKLFCCTA